MVIEAPSSELAPILHAGDRPHHILSARQFTRDYLEDDLFPRAAEMEDFFHKAVRGRGERGTILKGKVIEVLFYEPSTRTRKSNERAVLYLGGDISTTENAREFSSAVKGEKGNDSGRVFDSYGLDGMIIRHHITGGVAEIAASVPVPVINAGDGSGEHPTQTLLDTLTIFKERGGKDGKGIDGINVAMVGDMNRNRTSRSLSIALAQFDGIHVNYISPPGYEMQSDVLHHLDQNGVTYDLEKPLKAALPEADIVYVVRPQRERSNGNGKNGFVKEGYIELNTELLEQLAALSRRGPILAREVDLLLKGSESQNDDKIWSSPEYRVDLDAMALMKESARVLHPMPRTDELPQEVDSDPRVAIFRQVQNGLFTRMALLHQIYS